MTHTKGLEVARVARLLLLSLATGCALEPLDEVAGVDGELETRSAEQGIENGELRPSKMNGGTVLLRIWGQVPNEGTKIEYCSGQVISRDSILTAAHCFYNVGYFGNSWVEKLAVEAYPAHQNSDGSWRPLSAVETFDVYVPQAYDQARRASLDNKRHGLDIAVLQRRKNLENTLQGDAASIATNTGSKPAYLWAYGHGYHTDSHFDGQLRRGKFLDLFYDRNSASSYFRTILAEPGPNDPHTCASDSGGPWKTDAFGSLTPTSGVIFGVNVWGKGSGECAEQQSRAAIVADHSSWIESRVRKGRGACAKPTVAVGTYYGAMNVPTLRCW